MFEIARTTIDNRETVGPPVSFFGESMGNLISNSQLDSEKANTQPRMMLPISLPSSR